MAKLAGSEGVTQIGTTVGTVAYMSPEQARGDEVDHRTDLWSLGIVLFEMLTGRSPFQGDNLLAISRAIMDGDLPALTGVPSLLRPVVARMLKKEKGQRYQTATELLGDLRVAWGRSDGVATTAPSEPDVPSIAVLPFVNMSADPEQEYFCDGLAEELIDALARLDGLRVVGRTSSFQFRGQGHDLRQIGQALSVTTVLEGSVRKAGARLRINVQLISTKDGYHLWSERYDRELEDVFAVQESIARQVVEQLKVTLLPPSSEPLVQVGTTNLEAYSLCLKGVYYNTRARMAEALDCFTQALAIDPDYPQAHAGTARVYVMRTVYANGEPHDLMPKARDAAQRALALDESVADAHGVLALVHHLYDWDWQRAEQRYRLALGLNPGSSIWRSSYALFLSQLSREEESLVEARRAVDLDPVSAYSRYSLAAVYIYARRFDEACEEARKTLELDPAYELAALMLGNATAATGAYDDAGAILERARRTLPSLSPFEPALGWVYGRAGQRAKAEDILKRLEQLRRTRYVSAFSFSAIYAGLGDCDPALVWLERAYDEHAPLLSQINVAFFFDPLRSDPRFQALLAKMQFPGTARVEPAKSDRVGQPRSG